MQTPTPTPPQPPVKKPIPLFIWVTLGLLSLASVLCFLLAFLLAPQWPPKPLAGAETTPTVTEGIIAPPLSDPPATPGGPGPAMQEPSPTQPATTSETIPPITEYEIPQTTPGQPAPQPAAPAPAAVPARKPGQLMIVLDDMGLAPEHTTRAIKNLPAEVTFAFLPYPRETPPLARRAKEDGHTIMVHIPMEPHAHPGTNGETLDSGPNTLRVSSTEAQWQADLTTALTPLKGLAVGANNHMGSKFTEHKEGMKTVLKTLDAGGLFFLDSKTIAGTATQAAASELSLSIPLYTRDVFLDHVPTEEAITVQLNRAVQLAQKTGRPVIAIGHPHPATLTVLERMLPSLTSATGVSLAPLNGL